MTDVEKIVIDLHRDWAADPGNMPSLQRLFDLMSEKYPDEMKAAFNAGHASRQQTISRHE